MDVNLSSKLLPSPNFVSELKTNYELDKLARLITELEVLAVISNKIPAKMTDDDWSFYYDLKDTTERESFLRKKYYVEKNEEKLAEIVADAAPDRKLVIFRFYHFGYIIFYLILLFFLLYFI